MGKELGQQAQAEELGNSRFGAIGRFFEKVTRSNHKHLEQDPRHALSRDLGQEEDYFTPHLADQSPLTRLGSPGRPGLASESQSGLPHFQTGRKHSKTMHYEQRPLLSQVKSKEDRKVAEEKLREIDNIVFNQNKVSI